MGEIEEGRKRLATGHLGFGVAKLVEKRVNHGGHGVDSDGGHILQELGEDVQGLRWDGLGLENLGPGAGLDLGEGEVGVVGVHGEDLLARGCAQDLDDLHQLIDGRLAREEGLPEHELGHDTPGGPQVNGGGVVSRPKDELWRAVVARADVGDIGLASHKDLGTEKGSTEGGFSRSPILEMSGNEKKKKSKPPKITELENSSNRVEEKVLGLNVAVANSEEVGVGKRSQ